MINNTIVLVIEGIDGSGKTWQTERLRARFEKAGKRVSVLEFPQYSRFFGRSIGEYLNGQSVRADQVDSHSMSLWYAMDRWDSMQRFSWANCDVLIINRYVLSNAVYQSIRDIDKNVSNHWEWIKELEYGELDLPIPDLYLVLDVDPNCAQKNVDQKGSREYIDGRDVYEEQEDLLERARKRYLEIAVQEPSMAVVHCMEDDQLLSADVIEQLIWDTVQIRM